MNPGGGGFQVFQQQQKSPPDLAGRNRLLTAGLIIFVLVILLSSAATVVEVGTVGVVKRLGRVTGSILDPGLHFIVPFTDSIIVYNTKDIVYETAPLEKQSGSRADYIDFPVDSTTNDGQQVLISYSIRFHILRTGPGRRVAGQERVDQDVRALCFQLKGCVSVIGQFCHLNTSILVV